MTMWTGGTPYFNEVTGEYITDPEVELLNMDTTGYIPGVTYMPGNTGMLSQSPWGAPTGYGIDPTVLPAYDALLTLGAYDFNPVIDTTTPPIQTAPIGTGGDGTDTSTSTDIGTIIDGLIEHTGGFPIIGEENIDPVTGDITGGYDPETGIGVVDTGDAFVGVEDPTGPGYTDLDPIPYVPDPVTLTPEQEQLLTEQAPTTIDPYVPETINEASLDGTPVTDQEIIDASIPGSEYYPDNDPEATYAPIDYVPDFTPEEQEGLGVNEHGFTPEEMAILTEEAPTAIEPYEPTVINAESLGGMSDVIPGGTAALIEQSNQEAALTPADQEFIDTMENIQTAGTISMGGDLLIPGSGLAGTIVGGILANEAGIDVTAPAQNVISEALETGEYTPSYKEDFIGTPLLSEAVQTTPVGEQKDILIDQEVMTGPDAGEFDKDQLLLASEPYLPDSPTTVDIGDSSTTGPYVGTQEYKDALADYQQSEQVQAEAEADLYGPEGMFDTKEELDAFLDNETLEAPVTVVNDTDSPVIEAVTEPTTEEFVVEDTKGTITPITEEPTSSISDMLTSQEAKDAIQGMFAEAEANAKDLAEKEDIGVQVAAIDPQVVEQARQEAQAAKALEAANKAKQEEANRIESERLAAEAKAEAERAERARIEAEEQARIAADLKAKAEAEAKAKAAAEAKAKAEAEAKAQEEAARLAEEQRLEAELEKAEAERIAMEAQAERDRLAEEARQQAEAKAKAEAEAAQAAIDASYGDTDISEGTSAGDYAEAGFSQEDMDFATSFDDDSSSSDSGGGDSGGGGGGCFVTTATLQEVDTKDDGKELTTFRDFRDNYLSKKSYGPALVKDYYDNAPAVVKEINSRQNHKQLYKGIWDDYLRPINQMIEKGEDSEATSKYMIMMEDLKERYLPNKGER